MTCEQLDECIDAYLDGTLAAADRAAVERHLEGCATCRTHRDGLRAVLAAAATVSNNIQPPRDLWPEIAARLPERAARPRTRPSVWRRWVPLAAAALVLIAVTAVVSSRIVPRPLARAMGPDTATGQLAGFTADREYALAAEDLERVLREGRSRLAPATVVVIERNLALIDAAIAEARAALEADPANADLRALLWGAHRQKLDLLDRATRLTRS